MATDLFYGGPSAEDRICEALTENLLLLYPDGPPAEDAQIQRWMKEIVQAEGITQQIQQELWDVAKEDDNSKGTARTATYERGLERAIQGWKSKAAENKLQENNKADTKKKAQKKSFSLFDQMDQGLWGAPRITMEEIQEAASLEDRLVVLQRVPHVDDLMLDWKEVLPLLKEAASSLNTIASSSKQSSSDQQQEQLINDFWMLHRKWFDQGRASPDHLTMRYDLCHNVLDAVVQVVIGHWNNPSCWRLQPDDNFTATQDYLIDLWSLWYDMWYDLLQLPVGLDEDVGPLGTMGHKVVCMMLDLEVSQGEATSGIAQPPIVYPAHLLSFVDPTATWFQAWAARMAPVELARLVNLGELLPQLWKRATVDDNSKVLLLQHQSNAELLNLALRQHSLSMIRSILTCTRLRWFPSARIWAKDHPITPLSTDPMSLDRIRQQCEGFRGIAKLDGNQSYEELLTPHCGITLEQAEHLFALFLEVGDLSGSPDFNQDKVKPIVAICAEAIEVILLGLPLVSGVQDGEAASSSMITTCRDRAAKNGKSSFDTLIARVLQRLDP